MGKIFIKFCDIETEKQKFHDSKSAISIKDVDIKQIILSGKFLASKHCGYLKNFGDTITLVFFDQR